MCECKVQEQNQPCSKLKANLELTDWAKPVFERFNWGCSPLAPPFCHLWLGT